MLTSPTVVDTAPHGRAPPYLAGNLVLDLPY